MRTTKADREMVRRFESAEKLLARFGLQTRGFDPGVTCYDAKENALLHFGHEEWRWLEPILRAHVKLRGFRVRGRR
jgi:hypothetical protein